MQNFMRFRDWPLRLKMGFFFVGVAVLPLLAVTLIEFESQRKQIIENVSSLLSARGDDVAGALDEFNGSYLRSASRLAGMPEVRQYLQGSNTDRQKASSAVTAMLTAWHVPDGNLRGVGLIDPSGIVVIATEKALIGRSLEFQGYLKQALRGSPVVSGLYLAIPEAGSAPTVAFAHPLKDAKGAAIGAVILWVRAESVWKILEERNGKAGDKSFAVMFDQFGVRIGHSYNKEIVFHPGGKLEPATVDAMVAERRFGEKTRGLLEARRDFAEQFDRARAESPDTAVFRGFAPVNQTWNYGTARRLRATPWTVFYMVPEASLEGPIRALTERIVTVGIVIVLVALGFGVIIARGILAPIALVSRAAESLGKGDLSARAAVAGKDEIGRLGAVFDETAERLDTMIESEKRTSTSLQAAISEYAAFLEKVGSGNLSVRLKTNAESIAGRLGLALNQMAENLGALTARMKEGAAVLNDAAAEISSTTSQIGAAAAETATAVSQTTSTVEEVKQTALVSTDKARHVSESAQRSAQSAQRGRKSVEQSVEAMQRIQAQMESIAESIVRLSEQGQAIGEIIATVNDLAEQSNLLAVNAAIEAAKAGEQGKGFAVVAQEVKSLSEQSKQATAQVRSILGDIQKATSGAVMATEQGSKAVEAGVKLSSEVGESIQVLAESIEEAARAATQIAVSAQQQLVGMDQVALAMRNIEQASTQNVAGTKQTEAAAKNLHELGAKLKKLVEQYQV